MLPLVSLAILIAIPPKAMSLASNELHGTYRNLFTYLPVNLSWNDFNDFVTGSHSETSVTWYPYNTYTEKRE